MALTNLATGNITIPQITKTKEWLSEFEKKFNMKVTLSDEGRVTIKGNSQSNCDEALIQFKRRVQLEDFQNALEIARLLEKHTHREEFLIAPDMVESFTRAKIEDLKKIEKTTGCVIKIDRLGNVSIFGSDKLSGFARSSFELVHQKVLEEKALESAATTVSPPAPTPPATLDNIDNREPLTLLKPKTVKIESSESSSSNTPSTPSNIEAILEEDLRSTTVVSINEISKASSVDEGAGATVGCNAVRLVNFKTDDTKQQYNDTKKFTPKTQDVKNSYNNGEKKTFEGEKSFGSAAKFKESCVIASKDTGRVIGGNHKNQLRLENNYKCRVMIRPEKHSEFSTVIFEGDWKEGLEKAKKSVLGMLNYDGSWKPNKDGSGENGGNNPSEFKGNNGNQTGGGDDNW